MDELTRESNRPDQSQTFKCFHFTRISEFIGKITYSDWSIFYIVKIPAAGAAYWMVFHIRPNAIAYVTMATSYLLDMSMPIHLYSHLSLPWKLLLTLPIRLPYGTLGAALFFSKGHKRYRGQNRGKIRYKRSPCLGNTAEFTPSYKNAKNFVHIVQNTHA